MASNLSNRGHLVVWLYLALFGIALVLLSGSRTQAQAPPVTDLAFSPDGKQVLTCSQQGVEIFDWPSLKRQHVIPPPAANLHCLAFSPNGNELAVGGGDPAELGIVQIYSWPDREPLQKYSQQQDSVTSLAWQSQQLIVSTSLDRSIHRWNTKTGELVQSYQGHSRGVTGAVLLKNDQLVSAGLDQSLRVWDAQTGQLLRSLNQHTQPIQALVLKPQGNVLPMVATAASDRTIRFWQPTTGRMVRYIRLKSEPLDLVWIEATKMAASCVDGQVYLIDTDRVKVIQSFPALPGWAYAIKLHPSDGTLAVGGPQAQLKRIKIQQDPTTKSNSKAAEPDVSKRENCSRTLW